MQSMRLSALGGMVLGVALACSLPLTGWAAHSPKVVPHRYHPSHAVTNPTGKTVLSFGIQGGNIRPWTVTIDDRGTVTSDGPVTLHTQSFANSRDTLNGLLKMIDAEKFFTLSSTVQCPGTLPDIAARWVRVAANGDVKRVNVHGQCNEAFNQVFAVLAASVGVAS